MRTIEQIAVPMIASRAIVLRISLPVATPQPAAVGFGWLFGRVLAIVSSPSSDDRSTAVGEPYLQSSIANCVWLASVPKLRRLTQRTTKRDSMTGRITGAVVAAMLLGSAGIASAQIDRTGPTCSPNYTSHVSPRYNFYYNRHYWEELAPAGRIYRHAPTPGRFLRAWRLNKVAIDSSLQGSGIEAPTR
jgi:hypothetical protein